MRAIVILAPVVLNATLCACAPPQQPYVLRTSYSDADFQPWTGSGPASLHGQAFLKTVGGDVKTCAGNKVTLMPATPYNKEVMSAPANNNYANRDARADAYLRTAICDAAGNFSFANLPAEEWFVQASVTWGVPTVDPIFHQPDISTQGGFLLKDVSLQNGDNSVIMTGDDMQGT